MINDNAIRTQISECAHLLEDIDMQLNDLHATQYYLAAAMGQYGDECSRVFGLLNSVVEDVRGSVNEAIGCALRAKSQIDRNSTHSPAPMA